ncbi:hypothetical protein V9K20_003373 [Vibrio cholerae]|uniref:hypothetical protein n=1 Tax=Vibrio TaxID=662 RepID=UPI0002A3B6FC|nr:MULTISPECIES: hypothetical protein [Vibrio]EGR0943095.1 hypothetical protein [Vibrio cholerae]HAS8403022.1 hypothetical protein [Vibrio vulnificus]EKY32110.1 hypothetical protein OSU_2266 [Vibrio cholerae PS15]ELH5152386.1 hypothetical protein [Vibrio cholerae]WKY95251.1 hypothetical protein QYQ96_15025 [Vibrio metoecus]
MSTKLIQSDFECLKVFVNKYRLPGEDNVEYFKNLKRTHKVYFSVLELHSVCKGLEPLKNNVDSTFAKYLGESISELGSSLFISLHGCYKGSDQILRSSIENFLKAFGSTVHSDITTIKNTYEVIDKSGDALVFQTKELKEKYHRLKVLYSTLCASVHTATESNMQNVGALGHFPYFDADSSARFMGSYITVSTAILDILCWSVRAEYSKVHYKSKDIIEASLSRNIKTMIYSGEASIA